MSYFDLGPRGPEPQGARNEGQQAEKQSKKPILEERPYQTHMSEITVMYDFDTGPVGPELGS